MVSHTNLKGLVDDDLHHHHYHQHHHEEKQSSSRGGWCGQGHGAHPFISCCIRSDQGHHLIEILTFPSLPPVPHSSLYLLSIFSPSFLCLLSPSSYHLLSISCSGQKQGRVSNLSKLESIASSAVKMADMVMLGTGVGTGVGAGVGQVWGQVFGIKNEVKTDMVTFTPPPFSLPLYPRPPLLDDSGQGQPHCCLHPHRPDR